MEEVPFTGNAIPFRSFPQDFIDHHVIPFARNNVVSCDMHISERETATSISLKMEEIPFKLLSMSDFENKDERNSGHPFGSRARR